MLNRFAQGVKTTGESYEEAVTEGLKYYYGEVCNKGHSGQRVTATGRCISCVAKVRSKAAKEGEDAFFGHESKMLDNDHWHDNDSIDYSLDSIDIDE